MDEMNAAPAANESTPLPDTSQPSQVQDTGRSETQQSSPTAREALAKALETVEARDEGREPVLASQRRTPDGKFAARDQQAGQEGQDAQPAQPAPQGALDAPGNFNAEAKAAWAGIPDVVKTEVNRRVTELESGLRQYQEAWEPLRGFDEMARQYNTTIPQTLEKYLQISNGLRADDTNVKLGTIDMLVRFASNGNTDLRGLAAILMGQKPDEVQQQHSNQVNTLNRRIQQLEAQIGGVSSTLQSQQSMALLDYVTTEGGKFPRFEELSGDIAFFIETGKAGDIGEAYQLAERMNPAPAPIPAAPANAAQTRGDPAHTRQSKGGLSVTGAPGPGSNPGSRVPSASNREALQRAMAQVGMA